MPNEIFDDKMESLAMDIVEDNRDDIHTYAHSEEEHITFECKSSGSQAFILQKVSKKARIHDFILPYQAFDFKEFVLEYEHDLSRSHTECLLCGEAGPDASYMYRGTKNNLHKECAEQYNSVLQELKHLLEPHDEEIKSNIVSVNV